MAVGVVLGGLASGPTYDWGYDSGYSAGKEEGLKQGLEQGRVAGYDSGYSAGKEEGLKQGLEQGRVEYIIQHNADRLSELLLALQRARTTNDKERIRVEIQGHVAAILAFKAQLNREIAKLNGELIDFANGLKAEKPDYTWIENKLGSIVKNMGTKVDTPNGLRGPPEPPIRHDGGRIIDR